VSVKIYLPEETRAKVQASCAMRSLSMNEVLLEYIEKLGTGNEPVLERKASARQDERQNEEQTDDRNHPGIQAPGFIRGEIKNLVSDETAPRIYPWGQCFNASI
jgi:hypothetical protein